MGIRAALLGIAGMLLAGCTSIPSFDPDETGKVQGELLVFWVSSDKFVYYPAPGNALTYILPPRLAKKLGRDRITPGLMYTDGGSIPEALRGFAGFSPWGYGPAYIVHDWLFAAHRCLALGRGGELLQVTPDQLAAVQKTEFDDSATVLLGIINDLARRGVVQKQSFAPGMIYTAVSSDIARRLWDQRDERACTPVSTADREDVVRALFSSGAEVAAAAPIMRPTDANRMLKAQPASAAVVSVPRRPSPGQAVLTTRLRF